MEKVLSLRGIASAKLASQYSALGVLIAAGLVACGGGSGTATPVTPAATTISGVIATGAAVPGAAITVKDADATTADVTGTAGATGEYTLDVSNLKPPLVVSATGTQNGEAVTIVAVVPSLSASANNTANVTSLTNAIAALIAPGGDLNALNTPATLTSATSGTKVADASKLVVNTLKTDPIFSALLGTNFDPLTTVFSANGIGIDSVLDKVQIVSSTAGVSIASLAAPIDANGAPAAITLTQAAVATPTVVQTLPASIATSNLPTAAEMLVLAKKFEACAALPLAQRVTLDTNKDVTAVSATCNYGPTTWKSDGGNWADRAGQNLFRYEYLNGAKIGAPTIAAVFPAANNTGTTFQHPMCNTDTCIVMSIPVTSASGKPFQSTWVVGRIGGKWDYVGNQLPYSIGVEMRMNRKIAVNTPTADYFRKDRFEAYARLAFSPKDSSNTGNVRSIVWKGPGLPAAGVVSHRSQSCGTADRFGISNQQGSQFVSNSTTNYQLWTGSSGTDFYLDLANLDGTTLAMPVPTSNWATVASQADQNYAPAAYTAAIPAYSVYTAEIYYYTNTTPGTPDEVIRVRNGTPHERASGGTTKNWPTVSPTFITNYLTPTGSAAGSINSLTGQTISWTNPVNDYVSFAYLFSQNSQTATNSENETGSFRKRGQIFHRVNTLGDTSAAAYEFFDGRSGASLSTTTASSGTNPNPRCGNIEVLALETATANSSSYREAGLQFRGNDRKLYTSVYFWNN